MKTKNTSRQPAQNPLDDPQRALWRLIMRKVARSRLRKIRESSSFSVEDGVVILPPERD
jgi:hypothetical protein